VTIDEVFEQNFVHFDGNSLQIAPGFFNFRSKLREFVQQPHLQDGGWFYFNASPENGTQKYLHRVSLNGSTGIVLEHIGISVPREYVEITPVFSERVSIA
jgi:hypothetical protein